jgi:hypothetical protein
LGRLTKPHCDKNFHQMCCTLERDPPRGKFHCTEGSPKVQGKFFTKCVVPSLSTYMKLSLRSLVAESLLLEISIEEVKSRMARSKSVVKAVVRDYPELEGEPPEVAFRYADALLHIFEERVTDSQLEDSQIGLGYQWLVSRWLDDSLAEFIGDFNELSLNGIKGKIRNLIVYDVESYFQVIQFATEKNILNIKKLGQLGDIIFQARQEREEFNAKDTKKKQIEALKKEAQTEHLGTFGGWNVYIPNNEASAKLLGLSTRWCTAATEGNNLYSQYHKPEDPLVVFTKKGGKGIIKRQMHLGRNECMDEQNQAIPADQTFMFQKILATILKNNPSALPDRRDEVIARVENKMDARRNFPEPIKNQKGPDDWRAEWTKRFNTGNPADLSFEDITMAKNNASYFSKSQFNKAFYAKNSFERVSQMIQAQKDKMQRLINLKKEIEAKPVAYDQLPPRERMMGRTHDINEIIKKFALSIQELTEVQNKIKEVYGDPKGLKARPKARPPKVYPNQRMASLAQFYS